MVKDEGFLQRNVGDVAIISFTDDRILDPGAIERLGASLRAHVDSDPRDKFVLDFSAVGYMSSAMLGMLINLQKKVAAKGGTIKLAAIKDSILEVFRITKLDAVFAIYRSEDAAVFAFERKQ